MLLAEAKWVGDRLEDVATPGMVVLDLGSSSREFRTSTHPWVESSVFAPLVANDCSVLHADLEPGPDIEIVADFTRADDVARLRSLEPDVVIFTNVMEHLEVSPDVAAQIVRQVTPIGGRAIVSVPRNYPPHPNPIDNGYRPTVDELTEVFDGFRVLEAVVVRCKPMAFYFAKSGRGWFSFALRLLLPFYRPKNWWSMVRFAPTAASATCLLLVREEPERGQGRQEPTR